MKATERHQVRKRDGRVEWLRASKLAHSIHQAIAAARESERGGGGADGKGSKPDAGVDPCDPHGEEWRTLDLTSAVLTGVRLELRGPRLLSTARLSEAVEQVLFATGFPAAAAAYGAARGAHTRRRSLLRAALSLPPGLSTARPVGDLRRFRSGASLHDHGPAADGCSGECPDRQADDQGSD